MNLFRRRTALRTALAGLSAAPLALRNVRAQAVDFPDRPLRLVVGFPPGGPNDLLARIVAPGIGERLKRSVVVENRAGANGEIAAASVAKAPTDGSVFMLASNGSTTVAAALNKTLPYDVRTDFAAVVPVGINPMLLVVRPDLPAKNVAELLAIAHDKPGKLNGASAGAGGATHLALELFKSLGKADIVHVPYKGGGPALVDLISGQVQMTFSGVPQILPHLKAGRVKVIAIGHPTRIRSLPDAPPVADVLPGFNNTSWYGLLAPAGTPAAIVNRINVAMNKVLADPEFGQRLLLQGVEPVSSTPQAMRDMIANELARWRKVIKDAGITADSAK